MYFKVESRSRESENFKIGSRSRESESVDFKIGSRVGSRFIFQLGVGVGVEKKSSDSPALLINLQRGVLMR